MATSCTLACVMYVCVVLPLLSAMILHHTIASLARFTKVAEQQDKKTHTHNTRTDAHTNHWPSLAEKKRRREESKNTKSYAEWKVKSTLGIGMFSVGRPPAGPIFHVYLGMEMSSTCWLFERRTDVVFLPAKREREIQKVFVSFGSKSFRTSQ